MNRVLLFLAAMLSAGADFQQPDLTILPFKVLEGTWNTQAIMERGNKTIWTGYQWTFKGNQVAMLKNGKANFTGTFLDNRTSSPWTIDIKYNGGTITGIYQLEGDDLQICCVYNSGPQRPDRFDGGKYTILIFQRAR